ncbi:DUF4249 family protein [Plebeiibacterium sediminum]|uniref:DUF4249 domain-containing protein n=1 Tax=Plebeiibacterium sediminum TaxID=2992112 RepID=A0AAE3SF73_9BACT|nr:DUF4249 family protein [Plebeiobacterium sediminum]MCW3787185.1 DUF4249 domain-containing protein [Plebeiobacterium sediminum]
MKNYNIKYLFLVIVISLFSCTEEIEMDLKSSEPKFVVDAVFTDQDIDHFVKLSISSDYFSNSISPVVSGATVVLSDELKEIELEEDLTNLGTYIIPRTFKGIYNQVYTLTISGVDIDGDGVEESYTASNTLYEPIPIIKLGMNWDASRNEERWTIQLYSKDNPDKEDFYAFAVYVNGKLFSDQISELEYAWDRYFNGNDVSGVTVQSILEEDSDGKKTETPIQLGDWVKLEMQTINEDYYHFINAVHEETGLQVPLFSGPPANVPSNVSNGAKGFFRVYSVSVDSIQVTQEILDLRDQ